MDAANILKPALARGELRAIGATTLAEYQKYFEKDKALERRFQRVMVDEPSVDDAISILRGLKDRYESHHRVRIKDEAIIAAVELSNRYITDRFLPDKAIDLIDESAAKLKLEMNSMPEELDELERRIRQLEIEREAIKRENDEAKLASINQNLSLLNVQRDTFKAKWLEEKELVDGINSANAAIEQLKQDAEKAEREGDYGKVAEIRYGRIQEEEKKVADLTAQLQELGADQRRMTKEEVDAEDIAESVAKATGIPVQRMMQSERERLLNLEDELHKRVVGQDEAIEAVSDAIRRNRAGLNDPNRPIGSFIFLGTTGVGKTELAKALAEVLFDDEHMMTRIDMSEYMEKHAVSRLVGAPPGYVGYEEGGQLTEAVRRRPYSVVLLDEVEKAHQDVFNILLQVMDDGRLTDGQGRTVDFKNTVLIMTSNIGSHALIDSKLNDKQKRDSVFETLRGHFRPEFLNRIDEVVMYNPLGEEQIHNIVKVQLKTIEERLKAKRLQLEVSKEALDFLAKQGYDPVYGARPLKRTLQTELLNPLSKEMISGRFKAGDKIKADLKNNALVLTAT